jgi:lysophospholipase L1-like esterase
MHIGLSLSPTQISFDTSRPSRAIVVFGDSLTEGAGASGSGKAYPQVAASLFEPARMILNRGMGGQTSTQIAARQGGIPLRLAGAGGAPGNLFPRTRDWMHRFETGSVNGLTHECLGTGMDESGLPYGDVRIYGAATAGFTDIGRQIYGAIAANYPAEPGSRWTISGAAQMIGGGTDGVAGLRLLLIEADELGGYLAEIAAPAFALNGARSSISATAAATHPFVRATHLLDVIPGSAVDITLRIFPGQFEAGDIATELKLTPGNGDIPAYNPEFTRLYSFDNGIEGWSPRIQDGHITPLSSQGGRLVIENDDAGILRGCELALAEIPVDRTIRIAFDIEITAGAGQIHVGGLKTSGGSWATTTTSGDPTSAVTESGHYELLFKTGNAFCNAAAFLSSGTPVTWALDNIVVEWGADSPQVEVLDQSTAALGGSGSVYSIRGQLAGIEGILTVRDGGPPFFTRSDPGDAVAVPYATLFVPEDAATRNIQWLWAGRNNADTPDIVLSDIAAMTDRIAGGRYLVGSILPSADDTQQTRQTIVTLNAALSRRYSQRYVDLLAALVAAAGQTTDDQQDAAAGLIPRSLRSDALHLNDAGYAIVAAAWVAGTIAMGW